MPNNPYDNIHHVDIVSNKPLGYGCIYTSQEDTTNQYFKKITLLIEWVGGNHNQYGGNYGENKYQQKFSFTNCVTDILLAHKLDIVPLRIDGKAVAIFPEISKKSRYSFIQINGWNSFVI